MRLVSERILESDKLNSLSAEAERLYHRWLQITDKHGVAHADPAVLRKLVFPKKPRLNLQTLRIWVEEVVASGLVIPLKGKSGEWLVRFYRFKDFNDLKFGPVFDLGVPPVVAPMTTPSLGDMSVTHTPDECQSYAHESHSSDENTPVLLAKSNPDVDVRKMKERNCQTPDTDLRPSCPNCEEPAPSCLKKLGCLYREPDPVPVSNTKPAAAQRKPASAMPTRKLGFDPCNVLPFDGWTAEQITEVVHYHWEYLPTIDERPWWRDHTNTEEYFKRNFTKMAQAVKPIPGKKKNKSARVDPIARIHDPNCAICQGKGIDALRPANLCACVRFKNPEGQFVSFYEYACMKHGKKQVDGLPTATVESYKKLNLPEAASYISCTPQPKN
jgi:hypothetical protein